MKMRIELHEITVRDLVEGYKDNQEGGVTGYGSPAVTGPVSGPCHRDGRKQASTSLATILHMSNHDDNSVLLVRRHALHNAVTTLVPTANVRYGWVRGDWRTDPLGFSTGDDPFVVEIEGDIDTVRLTGDYDLDPQVGARFLVHCARALSFPGYVFPEDAAVIVAELVDF